MNEGYHVTLSDQNGNMIGYLNPISCVISETLNGDDNLQMSCVYDDAGLWKQIKPGARIGVWMERAISVIEPVNMFTERYVVRSGVPYDDRAYWQMPNINEYENMYLGHLSPGQTVEITGATRFNGETVYSIQKMIDGWLDNVYIKSGILQILRVDGNYPGDSIGDQDHNSGHGTNNVPGSDGGGSGGGADDIPDAGDPPPGWGDTDGTDEWPDDWDDIPEVFDKGINDDIPEVGGDDYDTEFALQQYCVRTVTINENGISIEAVHITIDAGDKLVYFDEFNSEAPLIMNISEWVTVVNNFLAKTRQRKGNGIVFDECDAAAACYMNGLAMSINELFCSHLREIYGYEILRTGERIELCKSVGRNRGVVLEVGRNLASLEIVYSNDGGDLDGVFAYCGYDTTDGHELTYAKDKYAKSTSNRYTRYAIMDDSDASAQYDIGFITAVEAKLSIDATARIAAGEYKLRDDYVITVSPQPAQIEGIWDDTTIVLGDVVTIRDPRLPDGQVLRRVTQLQHDYLTNMITSITVGDVPKTLYDVIKKMR